MAKMKFDDLDTVANEAAVQTNDKEAVKPTKDLMVRGVSVEIYNTLRKNGHTFAGYAKIAVAEKMKRDGLI